MNRFVCILFLLFSVSCMTENVDIDSPHTFGPERIPMQIIASDASVLYAADNAVDFWNAEVGDLVFAYVGGGTPVIVRVDSCHPDIEEDVFGTAELFINDDAYIVACHVTICEDWQGNRDAVVRTMRHEFGHCLGLADDPYSLDLASVMSPGADRDDVHVTDADADYIRELLNGNPQQQ